MTPDLRLAVLDFETTGVDVANDRGVQVFFGVMDAAGQWIHRANLLINPGVPIPEGATAVHGITDADVQATGLPPAEAYGWLRLAIEEQLKTGAVLTAFNASFDLSLLHHELIRNGLEPLDYGNRVLDPFVVDKGIDKWRKGSRKLNAVARRYGVPVDDSRTHDAEYDCYITGQLALKILQHRFIAGVTPEKLFAKQVNWKRTQAVDFQAYLRGKGGQPDAVIDTGWPVHSSLPNPHALTTQEKAA